MLSISQGSDYHNLNHAFLRKTFLVKGNILFPIFRDWQQRGNSVLLGLGVDVCVCVFPHLTCVNRTVLYVLRVILYDNVSKTSWSMIFDIEEN